MKRVLVTLTLGSALLIPALSQKAANPFSGRWDLTVKTPKVTYPGWIEVVEKDGAMQVRVQPREGSVHPATDVKLEGSHLTLTMARAEEDQPAIYWDLTAKGGQLTGTQKRGDKLDGQMTGVRAPALKRDPPAAWTDPEPLFNGKDLTGWEPDRPSRNHWVARDGAMLNEKAGANIKTTRKFDDFKLHIEFNCPERGNSGVYLRGRYEIQVEYEPAAEDKYHMMGAIYGFLAPSADVPKRPGQWEGFDVTMVGRNVTIVRDGVTIINNREIPGITGGALDSNEGQPGPFYIQGDHTGGMKYRNITVSVPKKA